jgi:hypothetical protein
MNHGAEDDLSRAEAEALASLRRSPDPPGQLEDRVVANLGQRGLLRAARSPGPLRYGKVAAGLAAGLALFLAGVAVGGRTAAPERLTGSGAALARFALFLYEGPEYQVATEEELSARIDEYRRWAAQLRAAGHDVAGEKLKDGGGNLSTDPARGGPVVASGLSSAEILGGYFIFGADSYEQAMTLARGCPHLRYRGRVEVRQIDDL